MLHLLSRTVRATTALGSTSWLCQTLLCFALLGSGNSAASDRSILVIGDSISAAYGMALEQGWVALLDRRLREEYPSWHAVNASISGDTTGGGRRRLPDLLASTQPDIVIIELGGNDGLRGYPIASLRENLAAMIALIQDAGAVAVVLEMAIPPNFGTRYTHLFRESFNQTARAANAVHVPFILNGIATEQALMQPDGIHPTQKAQIRILDNIWPSLVPLLNPNQQPLN